MISIVIGQINSLGRSGVDATTDTAYTATPLILEVPDLWRAWPSAYVMRTS